jgi:hypothetical protein
VEQGLKLWGENHDELQTHVTSLENNNKELNSHNFHSHHSIFLPPKHSSNFGSFNEFMHKLRFDVPRFDGEEDRERTRWINRLKIYFELHKMCDDEEKINFASLHLDKEASDCFLWWHSKSQSREWETFRKHFFRRFHNIEEKEVFSKLT